jgi:hypothetical protein
MTLQKPQYGKQARIARFLPAFIRECQKAIDWSYETVRDWLLNGMFKEEVKKYP